MKALLVDPQIQTITEIEHSGDWREIKKLIGNDCENFTAGFAFNNRDTVYVDDEGLYHENIGGLLLKGGNHVLVGRAVILGTNSKGESVAVKSTIQDFKNLFMFIPAKNNGLVEYFNQFQ